MVRFSYEERTIDGTLIDQSPPGVAETFAVRHLIAGLREGVQLMPAGSTYEFYLLPDLAFGPLAAHNIGPGNALQFTITLEEVD